MGNLPAHGMKSLRLQHAAACSGSIDASRLRQRPLVGQSIRAAMANFPLPKRGKRRAAIQDRTAKRAPPSKKPSKDTKGHSAMKAVKKAEDSPPKRIPYVRHGIRTAKSRNDRVKWCSGLSDFMNRGEKHVINVLKKHGHLPEWAGASCPHCTKGTLGTLKKWSRKQGGWGHRCNHSGCHRHVLPHAFHPIFVAGTGQSHAPLRDQASALFSAVAGASQVRTGRLVKKNH